MSLSYKFDKLGGDDAEKKGDGKQADPQSDIERYDGPDAVRTVCFVQENGMQTALDYAYMTGAQFSSDKTEITLLFSDYVVTLRGNNFETLFLQFLIHVPKKVGCMDERYAATKEDGEPFVSAISIEEKSKKKKQS